MFTKKEIIEISVILLILSFSLSLVKSVEIFLYALLMIFVVVGFNLAVKKIASFYLDSEMEVRIWEVERFGFKPKRHFKKPVPMGGILPLVTTVLSFGALTWLASLVFDVKPKIYKAARRHGLYAFSDMTEYEIGLIAAAGIIMNFVLAIAAYLIGYDELARLSIYYAFFNMIPISDLDGNKIFFGSIIMWSFLAAITLVGIGYALLIV
ncbi:hypothetical protein HYT24_02215 [Candidatus Pacearchaeota archaeon]|nr:hypothetical protein [Candidatus Pacearchaeota archaeon]